MSWDTLLSAPIPVAGSKPLVTLRDAAMLIQKLPRSQADLPAWQTATEALMLSAEDRGPLMHAEIGLRQSLHRSRCTTPAAGRTGAPQAHTRHGTGFGNS